MHEHNFETWLLSISKLMSTFADFPFACQGLGCARESRPGVYSRLSTGYDWIRESICDLSMERPSFCQPLEKPDGLIERVRVDAEFNYTNESLAGNELVFVSKYVDIFYYGEYEIETDNMQGKRRDETRYWF